MMQRVWLGAGSLALLGLAGCGKPDVTALQKLACEQAAANMDLASVKQVDTLRKALGVAPDVDPVAFCESIGAQLTVPPNSEQTRDGDQAPEKAEN